MENLEASSPINGPRESNETLLSVSNLRYQYGTRVAVDDVSFVLHEGECFGLLGPNGAGKTTTISCISGLLANWEGEMHFRDRSFSPATNTLDRASMGYVPQELAVYPNLTAKENLMFFARLSGVPKPKLADTVQENLQLAELTDRMNDRVSTFSGGMQRRLNLAAGLVHEPQLVLLDEPTVGVDPQSRNHLFETLLHLKQVGRSLLYTTHYMEEAQRLCDRVAIMNEGRIVAVGTQSELAASIDQPEADLEQIFLQLTGRSLRDE
ncbi:MAG: ABC transporter ATP-binding protein [Planctomycetota bacterium]